MIKTDIFYNVFEQTPYNPEPSVPLLGTSRTDSPL